MTNYTEDRVAAVIVTRNRLAMLEECVGALTKQTRPVDEIIIVDNDSTDGTRAWLAERPSLRVLHQANLGGAGGFHIGIRTAVERGHDWVWCMDDDGYPAADCLVQLLSLERDDLWLRGPLVLARDDPSRLAFLLRPPGCDTIGTAGQAAGAAQNGLLWDVACPFNGVLIHRQIVRLVGLPIAGMFLWGDENEYCLRAKGAGFKMATVSTARFYHPFDRMVEHHFKLFGRERCIVYVDEPLRDYLAIRNRAYILRHYNTVGSAIRHIGLYAMFYGKTRGLRGLFWAIRAGWAGLCGDWRGHQRFLH